MLLLQIPLQDKLQWGLVLALRLWISHLAFVKHTPQELVLVLSLQNLRTRLGRLSANGEKSLELLLGDVGVADGLTRPWFVKQFVQEELPESH